MLYKRFFYTLACLVVCAFEVNAQCPNDNTLNQALAEPTLGNTNTACCVWGGEYASMPVSIGTTYRIETCGGPSDDTYITVYNDASGIVLGFDDNSCGQHASLDYTATFSGTIRILVDIGAVCGANAFNHPTAVTNLGTLPVTWGGFAGEVQGGTVALTWETLLERQTSHFEVERSHDGVNYEIIGKEDALNLKSQNQSYQLLDMRPHQGANFYRVREVSLDGEIDYHSKVLEMFVDQPRELHLSSIFPNPASNRLNLVLESQSELPLHIRIYDLLGREVRQLHAEGQTQTNFELDLQGLESGNYILSVQQGSMLLRRKVAVLQE